MPLICPPPQPDCPLYHQRAITGDEQLRRAVLRERNRHPDLTTLIAADLDAGLPPRPNAPTLPTRPELPGLMLPLIATNPGVKKGVVHER